MTATHRAEKLLERQKKFGADRFYVFIIRDEEHVDVQYLQANTVFGAMALVKEIGVFVDPPYPDSVSTIPYVVPYPVLTDQILDLELP